MNIRQLVRPATTSRVTAVEQLAGQRILPHRG